MLEDTFFCLHCKQVKPTQREVGTGYGTSHDTGEKTCYACIGEQDEFRLKNMKPGERDYLYLSKDKDGKWYVTNWPGTLKRPIFASHPQKGKHNFARTRYDVWFQVGKNIFHGVQYGDFTQICHIKCLKP